MRPFRSGLACALVLLATGVRAALAQDGQSLGVGVHFQGIQFDRALGADVANLILVPLAYRLPLGERLDTDVYAAYARGAVEVGNQTLTLSGLVDTRIRASWQARPWAVVTVAVNLPTGNATHDPGEARVASVLATDMLGFREASWGTGFAVTSGVATAYRSGAWGIGFGASYRVAGDFEPRADTSFTYAPGDETRLRMALDRDIGQNKLTLGLTLQSYTQDKLDGRNLFQSGNRLRGDATYAFRRGRSTWTAYAADIWRERGDVTLDILGAGGAVVGDTTFHTGWQNLFIVGLSGATPLGNLNVRPTVDLRVQAREDLGGAGWLLAAGGDVPLRILGEYDVFPRGRFLFGQLESDQGVSRSIWGGELGLTVRWSP
ncbi:MAG: hypothetical protein HY704_06970 [Gemmatimonadetes bacterium]|nr:hypothetical protein [Gemmatimonadota bacterium]